MLRTVFNGYGLTVDETESGGLLFVGTTPLGRDGVAALMEALRKWGAASDVDRHLARRRALFEDVVARD